MCLRWSLGMRFTATPHRSQQRRDVRSKPIHHTDWRLFISSRHSLGKTWRRKLRIMTSFGSSKSQMENSDLRSTVNPVSTIIFYCSCTNAGCLSSQYNIFRVSWLYLVDTGAVYQVYNGLKNSISKIQLFLFFTFWCSFKKSYALQVLLK